MTEDEPMAVSVADRLNERSFLTAAGTETYLHFQQGFELPEFCAFTVFEDREAWSALERDYLGPILQLAADNGMGVLLDALVWRAHPDFIEKLGRSPDQLAAINAGAVSRTRESVNRWRQARGHDERSLPVLVAADVGPRGDGYKVEDGAITVAAARDYHRPQIQALADAGADLVCALTMTSVAESTGIVEHVHVVPAFAGLGAPYWDMYARGAIFGLTRGTTKAHIVKATLQSLAFQTKDVLEAMAKDSGMDLLALKVDGGATANDYLMQFQADILDVPVEKPAIIESTAMGAAYMAGIKAGIWDQHSILNQRQIDKVYTPNMEGSERNKLYSQWLKAIDRVRDWEK